MYRVQIQGVIVQCETALEVLSILPSQRVERDIPKPATLAAALGKPAKKKSGPKRKAKPADEVLTAEEKAKLDAEVPLICRLPHGCGKPFASANRRAWYCPPCTAKRDEGRAL